eukprot:TRINITY_DN4070_c4_g1_i2.p1 TRINITY_DN4070_c4_g1~~TRINITY_DN4070_c4_g1_i2.p1  ORF type:complete len:758 (+),score=145.69 TRINITY_DN4070_c4_g1_i2:73-2346(+)
MVASKHSPLSVTDKAASETAELVRKRLEASKKPLPGQARVTIDGVLQHIASNPGSSTCSSHDTLKRIWVSTCSVIAETLSRMKGVTMPGFGQFCLQMQKHNRGNWGDKTELSATFTLLPSYCQAYGLHTIQTSMVGAVGMVPLNTVLIAMKAGVGKDECSSALKDIYRKLGELAGKTATFSVDFGVARVVFHALRYEVHWNKTFLQKLDAHCKGCNSRAIRGVSKRPSSRASQKWYSADSLLPSGLETENPLISTTGSAAVAAMPSKAGSDLRKRRPATAGQVRSAVNGNGPAAQPDTPIVEKTAAPMIKKQNQALAPVQVVTNGIDTLREEVARPMTVGTQPSQPSPSSPRNPRTAIDRAADEHSVSVLRSQLSDALHYGRTNGHTFSETNGKPMSGTPPLSDDDRGPGSERTAYSADRYQQRLRNKANHRRLRNKAYVTAWEEQKKAKALRAKTEKEIDAQRLAVMQHRSKKEAANAQKELDDRKRIAQLVQQTNQSLSQNRQARHSNATLRPNVISWGDGEGQSKPLDISYLMKQVEDQKKKKQLEKQALEQAELTLLKQQQEKWRQEDEQDRLSRQREKEERLEAYRNYKLQNCQKVAQEDRDTTIGNFFFRNSSSSALHEYEKREKEDRRKAALDIQEENQRGLERARQSKMMAATLRKSAEKNRHDKMLRKAMEFEQREEEQRREERRQLKESWDNQIREKQAMRDAEKHAKQPTLHAWRNESSDEEYDDYVQPASPTHQKYSSRQKILSP